MDTSVTAYYSREQCGFVCLLQETQTLNWLFEFSAAHRTLRWKLF